MKRLIYPSFVILFALIFGSHLLRPGFMQTHDTIWHVERIMNMAEMLRSGQFPVRWSYNLDYGYGIPLFNFTYPAPYYLMALPYMLGLGVIATYNLTNLFFYALGGVGIYYLFRRKNDVLAVATAVLYLLTPYQFLDIFVRGALGEVVLLGLMPWCLYMVEILEKRHKLLWFTPLPLALALLSHNFLGFLFIGLLFFLTVFVYKEKKLIFAHIGIAVALAAFFLMPMVAEKRFLMEAPAGLQNSTFENHYVYPLQLLWGKWNYEGSLAGFSSDEISYQLGFANILLIVLGLILAKKKLWPYLTIVAVCLFLMTPYSAFLWDIFSFGKVIQFPWRLLAVVALVGTVITGKVLTDLSIAKPELARRLAFAAVIIAFFNTQGYNRPSKVLTDSEFATVHAMYEEKTATAYRYELMPKWAGDERPRPATLAVSAGSAVISDVEEAPYKISFQADGGESGAEVTVYRNFFPGWYGQVGHFTQDLTPSANGDIQIKILPGKNNYQVHRSSTPVEAFGNFISLISLAGIIFLWRKNGWS